ncbi:hypothetical protein C8R44DRAFT_872255 [Mycena epipterygia]|nr:hypothetical protein C8R44DRAFT_872255 [Mycena epipterygia]
MQRIGTLVDGFEAQEEAAEDILNLYSSGHVYSAFPPVQDPEITHLLSGRRISDIVSPTLGPRRRPRRPRRRPGHRRPLAVAPPHHPTHRLPPRTLRACRGPASYSTHALAIAPAGKDVGGPYAIFPVHAVVLAAHCATLRRCSRPAPAHSHSSVSLPALPLALPSPQAFAILHGFMYTHYLAPAFAALLPLPFAFLASLERLSNAQDTAHAAILCALATGTARHTLATCTAPPRATSLRLWATQAT